MTENKCFWPYHDWVLVSDKEDNYINFEKRLAKIKNTEIKLTTREMRFLAAGGVLNPNRHDINESNSFTDRMNKLFSLDEEEFPGPYNLGYISEIRSHIKRKLKGAT